MSVVGVRKSTDFLRIPTQCFHVRRHSSQRFARFAIFGPWLFPLSPQPWRRQAPSTSRSVSRQARTCFSTTTRSPTDWRVSGSRYRGHTGDRDYCLTAPGGNGPSSPSNTAYDSVLGLVSFIENQGVFTATPESGFSFDSPVAPGPGTFNATLFDGGTQRGSVQGPVQSVDRNPRRWRC